MTELEIDITVQSDLWKNNIANINDITEKVVRITLGECDIPSTNMEISIVLADDGFVQKLNKEYRDKDNPTNVLSFPQRELDELEIPQPFISLGDIIIAFETISKESQEQDKRLEDHFCHMLVHGCLHLLRYDHQNDDEAQIMEKLEIIILNKMEIKNPYETA